MNISKLMNLTYRGEANNSCSAEPELPVTLIVSGCSLIGVTVITVVTHLCKKSFATNSGSCFSTRYQLCLVSREHYSFL